MISSRSEYREWKSIESGGDFMNGSKGIGRNRVLASMAVLFAAIFTIFLLPAYGQQEVDPTWYDPAPNTAVSQASQPVAAANTAQTTVATARHQQAAGYVSLAPEVRKLQGKEAQVGQSRHTAAHKNGGTPSADNKRPTAVRPASYETWDAE
jgi:hypothetical protein